jgi:nicotinamidase-related amidase
MVKRIALRFLLVFGVFVLILVLNFVIFQRTAIKVTEGEPIENRDPDRVALLVIDIQEGTTGSISVTEGYIRQAEFFIDHVNKLVAEGVEKGWMVIWVRSEVNNPLINILNNTLARGTKGAELDERLDTSVGQVLVKKKSDSFNDTALDAILEANDIGRLVLAGLDAEHCVYSTVRAAAKRGYKLEVFEESVIAEDASDLAGLLETYQALGVELRSMKELGDL